MTMKLCEIINPSDAYTMWYDDENVKVAQAACVLIGNGQYALENEDGETVCPLLLFGNAEAYIDEYFDGMDGFKKFIDENGLAIADCLDSVMSFSFGQRFAYEEAIKVMTREQMVEYRDKVHDRNRSSMNNIGGYSWRLAKKLREKAVKSVES